MVHMSGKVQSSDSNDSISETIGFVYVSPEQLLLIRSSCCEVVSWQEGAEEVPDESLILARDDSQRVVV